jgi:glycosyltransferase involved in cell wall biosynthesis
MPVGNPVPEMNKPVKRLENQTFAILIPVFNPPAGWQLSLWERFSAFRQATGVEWHLAVIDDGSDRQLQVEVQWLTQQLGKQFTFLKHDRNQGKGAALKTGASEILADKYMFTDVDIPYSLESMVRIWESLKQHAGIVVGHREEEYYEEVSSFRTWLSKTLRALNTLILRLPVNDTQCGLKGFDLEVRQVLLDCKTDRFLIDLELLLAATVRKIHIHPVSVQLRNDIDFTRFKTSVLMKEVFSFLRLIWKYRISS